MKIYHISHTDLDGYACQFVLDFYFKNCVFFNSNYGREITDTFEMVLGAIDEDLRRDESEKFLVLISDLNLSVAQCEDFERALNARNAKILLLDHHQTGAEAARSFVWYVLDNARCATKIVYEFFARICGENERLAKLVAVVNAVDIWLKDDENFELGKVMMSMISGAREINRVMFNAKNSEYMFFLIAKAWEFVGRADSHIALDDEIHAIKKAFFRGEKPDTLGNLHSKFVVKALSEDKERLSIECEGLRGLLTYGIGNTSVVGNDFLLANPEFDFFVDVSAKKTLSFRSNGDVDVSAIAKKLIGGGGHKNAAGGLFMGFKDSSNYENIKAQIEDLIKNNEGDKLAR